ncbi:zinc transporter foi [Athalia rosae]|uniref:zinc transporter foi n=1 Tax=Athalia rosae TaxID=37344 RepID=UPI0020346E75|nr:zinc transporter foi [Athalia rosae]XP_012252568.2 zinc transporter foi [Athalia rosae]XP_012252571.2 zinc transporter foi [Athalia rosae]
MSQHFVTVCVVCVLCAAHAPCHAHDDVQGSRLSLIEDSPNLQESPRPDSRLQPLKNQIGSKEIVRIKDTGEKLDLMTLDTENVKERLRKKRDSEVRQSDFTRRIFEAYGNGDSITLEGFERLLDKLGLLEHLATLDERENDHIFGREEKTSGVDNIKNLNQTTGSSGLKDGSVSAKTKQKCVGSRELLATYSQDPTYLSEVENSTTLPAWLFERVCPALVYQLANSDRSGCIQVPDNWKPSDAPSVVEEISSNPIQVWIYSSISILIISLCGLLGVVVIPVMNKTYYHQLIQFLVALAVGTLCGDALIHLLPHAMMSSSGHSHSHEHQTGHEHHFHSSESDHDLNMWKGLVAMMGLVLFFFTEKALTMVAEWRKSRQRRNKLPLRVKVMRETDTAGSNTAGDKHCKHKYSSYPYCYGEITTETQDNHHNRHHNNHQRAAGTEEEKPLTSNSNAVCKSTDADAGKKTDENWKMEETIINHSKKSEDNVDPAVNEAESYTVIIREHETKHHGHTHSHGHVHSAPESMSSVAWMVVMGDGLHNFTDGMAIGAAFAANIAGGFSTAIAVLCHELPHELGDFAVLLKAGMSAKQAVFYNLLSSVLCLFGMIFGILLGATPAATSWIFAAAAGMFIYIALVDMIPELTSSHSAEGGSQWQCILQALGLAAGLGIMLIIALYEHDLKHIFSN